QLAKIRQYCSLHDLQLIEVFRDLDISGRSADNRPALQEMLRRIAEGRWQYRFPLLRERGTVWINPTGASREDRRILLSLDVVTLSSMNPTGRIPYFRSSRSSIAPASPAPTTNVRCDRVSFPRFASNIEPRKR